MSFPIIDKKDEHELVGYYFVTREKGTNNIQYQGRIASMIDQYGYFIVSIFNWLDGSESFSRVVSMDEIHRNFYLTCKDQDGHDDYCKHYISKLSVFSWEEK